MKTTRLPGLLLVAVVALVFFALAPSIRFGYVWDAVPAVEGNALVRGGSVIELLTSDYWRGTRMPDRTLYRPTTVSSFALERRVVGRSDPRLSHGVNMLLHAGVALLLFLWVREASGRDDVAVVSSLIFACHPLLLLTAVNVVGRAEILAAGFSLAALTCLGRASSRPAFSWGAALFLFLALGSKEVALATPALMLVQEVLPRAGGREGGGASWIARLAILAPSALATVVYLILRTAAIEAFPGAQPVQPLDNVLVGMEGVPRLATVLAIAARYGGLLVVPHPLSADYSGAAIARESSLFAPRPLAGLLLLTLLTALAFAPLLGRLLPTRAGSPASLRLLSMGASLFLLPYLLVGNIVALNGAGFAERLIYVPATGACVLAAIGLTGLFRLLPASHPRWPRRAAALGLAGALLAGVIDARIASYAWASDEAVLEATLRATPRSLRAHFALADLRMRQGRDDDALRLYEEALRDVPGHAASWLYRGVLLARRGRLEEGERSIRRSLEAEPGNAEALFFLGTTLLQRSRYDEGERALRRALIAHPGLLDARAALGVFLYERGRFAEAAPHLRRCVERGITRLEPMLRAAEGRGPRP